MATNSLFKLLKQPLESAYRKISGAPDANSYLDDVATVGGYLQEQVQPGIDYLANAPLPKAIGSVIANPSPQEIGQQVANVGGAFSDAAQQYVDDFSQAPIIGGTIVGKGAKGWDKLPGKFSNMLDKMERAEISDVGANFRFENLPSSKGRLEIADEYLKTKYGRKELNTIGNPKVPEELQKEAIKYADLNPHIPSVKLSSILDHPTLYREYPELKDINIIIEPASGLKGSFNKETNTISVGGSRLVTDTKEEYANTLLHEIQHAIQGKEGFASGGTPESASKSAVREYNSLAAESNDIINTPNWKQNPNLVKRKDQIGKKMRALWDMTYLENSINAYRRLGGEIESRSVASRSNIPQDQLKYSQPYAGENIPLKEWIRAEDYLDGRPAGPSMMTAYHGTPHKIVGGFKKEAIGSGEGAQAFGHGFYATESPDIAKGYAKNLSAKTKKFEHNIVPKTGIEREALAGVEFYGNIDDTIKYYKEESPMVNMGQEGKKVIDKIVKFLEDNRNNIKITGEKGRVYTLDIPEPDVMLDWDKPFKEQPQAVKDILENSGFPWIKQLKEQPTGKHIYDTIGTMLSEDKPMAVAASEYLASKGIKGINYPAGSISGAKTTARNFVIFEPEDIKITAEEFLDK